MRVILSCVFVLIVFSVKLSFALTISTSVHHEISGYQPENFIYVYQDNKSANSGSVLSHANQDSPYSGLDPDFPPLSTDITGQSTALSSSSGLLLVSTLTERPYSASDISVFRASASWYDTITNNEIHEQKFYLDLDISYIDMFVSKVYGDATRAYTRYETNVLLNNQIIWSNSNWLSSLNRSLEDLYPASTFSLHIPEASHNILLGTYNSGESFTLEYQATALSAMWDGADLSAYVSPFTVAGKVTSAVPVPEPSTLLLFGSGLLGLMWGSRKRQKS